MPKSKLPPRPPIKLPVTSPVTLPTTLPLVTTRFVPFTVNVLVNVDKPETRNWFPISKFAIVLGSKLSVPVTVNFVMFVMLPGPTISLLLIARLPPNVGELS